jgi:hypothetical protein
MEMGDMPLKGEYKPNPTQFVRDQVELSKAPAVRKERG